MGKLKSKRRERFIGIPYFVANSPQFADLSSHANKLLLDLLLQYTGSNNGKLSACWTLMRLRKWKSSSTLYKAKKELLDKGFIIVTKMGFKMRGHPTLLAITWNGIDECRKTEYDENINTNPVPLSLWNKNIMKRLPIKKEPN